MKSQRLFVRDCPSFEIKGGIDLNWYAVFQNNEDAEYAADHDYFYGNHYGICSFGQFENALRLTRNSK